MSLRNPVRWKADTADLTQYDPVLSHLCCWASHQAYYATAKDFFRDILGATDIYHIAAQDEHTLPQGFLFKLEECYIMCFGCTPNLTWLARELLNTKYIRPWSGQPNEYVGSIWGRAALAVWPTYQTILHQIVQSGKKLVFAGHSLGGAIAATLYGLFVQQGWNVGDPATCYTFGSPRVGTKSWRLRTGRSFCLQIPEDIVTKLPPASYLRLVANPLSDEYSVRPTDPFWHHGQLCDLYPDGHVVEQPVAGSTNPRGAGLELQLIEGAAAQIPGFNSDVIGARSYFQLWEEGYFNHHSETYLSRLEKALPQNTPDSQDLGDLSNKLAVRVMPQPEEPPHVLAVWDPQIPNPPKPPETFAPRVRRVKH